jgi:WD40 repeat protein
VRIWDPATNNTLVKLEGLDQLVWALVWSPDGKRLATVYRTDNAKSARKWEVTLWDSATGKKGCSFPLELGKDFTPEPANLFALQPAFSPDSKSIAAEYQGKMKIYSAANGAAVRTLPGSATGPVAWDPDGKRLAALVPVGDNKTAIQVWDVRRGKVLRTIHHRQGEVQALLWSPDGRRLLSGGRNNTIKVWDPAAEGSELLTLAGPSATLTWASDGRRLLSTGVGGPRVWDAGGFEQSPARRKEMAKKD